LEHREYVYEERKVVEFSQLIEPESMFAKRMNGDPNFIYYIDDGVEINLKEARRAPRNKNEYARLGNRRKSSAKVACERC
jgi:hypothetical protein